MSSGAEGIALLWKPIMWLFGGLISLVVSLVALVWHDNKNKVSSVYRDHTELNTKVMRDYMTREQTEALIDARNKPLIDALHANTHAQQEVVKELRQLRENQIKAGIYDG